MTDLVKKAKDFATIAHDGQLYGTGDPYIIHPTQVARLAKRMGYGEVVQAACYLHDALEDTQTSENDLRSQFPDVVVDAVVAVTFTGDNYDEKISQAMAHPVGQVVKFCDVSCNFANAVLITTKSGKDPYEVITKRSGYLSKLRRGLPGPDELEEGKSI